MIFRTITDDITGASDLTAKVSDIVNNVNAVGADSINTGVPINVSRNNDVAAAVNENTDEIERMKAELANGVLIRASDAQLLKVFDENMLNFLQANPPQIAFDVNRTIPDIIMKQNAVQPVINVHYDNMINVEGSVDKSFSKEFKQNADELYKNFTDRIYKEAKMASGSRPVRRSIL